MMGATKLSKRFDVNEVKTSNGWKYAYLNGAIETVSHPRKGKERIMSQETNKRPNWELTHVYVGGDYNGLFKGCLCCIIGQKPSADSPFSKVFERLYMDSEVCIYIKLPIERALGSFDATELIAEGASRYVVYEHYCKWSDIEEIPF